MTNSLVQRIGRFFRSLQGTAPNTPVLPNGETLYAVGDIHGCIRPLESLLAKIEAEISACEQPVQVIFLGDYIDRGHASKKVLSKLIGFQKRHKNTVFLRGNHEATLLSFLEDPSVLSSWLEFGAGETLHAYGVDLPIDRQDSDQLLACQAALRKALPKSHLAFFKSTQLFYEKSNCLFVHAGIDPDRPISQQSESEFLWIREAFLESRKTLDRIIVHGHTPEPEPVWDGRRIGVDTGVYLSQTLTAARISDQDVTFIQS